MPCRQWGTLSDTSLVGGGERQLYAMCSVGEDLCYVRSGGRSVTHVPKRGMGE